MGLIRLFCYHIMSSLKKGRLLEVLSEHVPPGVPVNILYNGEGLVPLKVRAFIDFCAPRLEDALKR